MTTSNSGNSVAFVRNTGKVSIVDIGDPASLFKGEPGQTYQGGNGVSVIGPVYGQLSVPVAGATCAPNFTIDLSKLADQDKDLVARVQTLSSKMQKFINGVPLDLKSIDEAKELNSQADSLRLEINEFNRRNVGTSDISQYLANVNAADSAYVQSVKDNNLVREILQKGNDIKASEFNKQNELTAQQEKDLAKLQDAVTQANIQVDVDNAKSVEDFKGALDQATARISIFKADPSVASDGELLANYDRALKAIEDIKTDSGSRTPQSIKTIQEILDNATQKLQDQYQVALDKYNEQIRSVDSSFVGGQDVVSAQQYQEILARLKDQGMSKTNPLGSPHALEIDGISLSELLKQQDASTKNIVSINPVNAGGSNNGANGPSMWVYRPDMKRNDYIGDSNIADANGDGATTEVELVEYLKAKFPGQYDDLTASKLRELSTDAVLVINTKQGAVPYQVALGVEAGGGSAHAAEKTFAVDLSEIAAYLKSKGIGTDDVTSISLNFMTTPGSWGSVGESIEIKTVSVPVAPVPPTEISLPKFDVKSPVSTAQIVYPSVTFNGVDTPLPNCPAAVLQGPANVGIPVISVPVPAPTPRLAETGFNALSEAGIAIGAIVAGALATRRAKKRTAANGVSKSIAKDEVLPRALRAPEKGKGALKSQVCFSDGKATLGEVQVAMADTFSLTLPALTK